MSRDFLSVLGETSAFSAVRLLPSGGITAELSIKVGNVKWCLPAASAILGGSIADTLFYKRLSLTNYALSAAVRLYAPAAGGE